MHMRAAMLIVLAVVFAAGTAILPNATSRTVTAADEALGVTRAAALSLQLSELNPKESTAAYQSAAASLTGDTSTAAQSAAASLSSKSPGAAQSLAEVLTGRTSAAAAFADNGIAGRYETVAAFLEADAGSPAAALAFGEAPGRAEAVSRMLAGRGLEIAGPRQFESAGASAMKPLADSAFTARPLIGGELGGAEATARYDAAADLLAGRELVAASVGIAGGAGKSSGLETAAAMALLLEHETEEEEGEEEEEEETGGDGATFESSNYDYTITFDDSLWAVLDEVEQEDDAGNPFEVLVLGSEELQTYATFYGLTSDFNDVEECVESLVEYVEDLDGNDELETRDDIEGDDEDASVVIDYEYTSPDDETSDWTSLVRCQVIEEGEVFLLTWYDTLHDNFEDTEDERDELLSGVEIG